MNIQSLRKLVVLMFTYRMIFIDL